MRPEELMIGDWVCLVDPDTKKRTNTKVKGSDLCGGGIFCLQWFEPIPLTPEILEKNGFIEITGRVKRLTWAWKKQGTHIEVNEATPNWYQIVIHKEASDLGDERIFGRYVHELQHALKLIGITKEIKP